MGAAGITNQQEFNKFCNIFFYMKMNPHIPFVSGLTNPFYFNNNSFNNNNFNSNINNMNMNQNNHFMNNQIMMSTYADGNNNNMNMNQNNINMNNGYLNMNQNK